MESFYLWLKTYCIVIQASHRKLTKTSEMLYLRYMPFLLIPFKGWASLNLKEACRPNNSYKNRPVVFTQFESNEPLASGSLLEYFNLPIFSSRSWVFSINLLGDVSCWRAFPPWNCLVFGLLKHGLEIINYYLPLLVCLIPIVLGATCRHSVSQPAGFWRNQC